MQKNNKKQQQNPFIQRVKPRDLVAHAKELREQGYSVLMPTDRSYIGEPREKTWNDFIHAQLRSGQKETGKSQRHEIPSLYFSSGNEVKTSVADKGTKDLGWMEWGYGNILPNIVSMLTHMLPYTAAGIDFNTKLCAAAGPQPMYDTTQYVGGNITNKFIRYKDAGTFLRGQIIDRQRELLKLLSEKENAQNQEGDGISGEGRPTNEKNTATPVSASLEKPSITLNDGAGEEKKSNVIPTADEIFNDLVKSIKEEIEKLQKALKEWETTEPSLQAFLDANNLTQVWLSLVLDQEMFGISFPEIQLNQQAVNEANKPVASKDWFPKVVGLAHRSCHTTRLERMDENGKINYVYCSNRWLDKPFVDQGQETTAEIIAIPALDKTAPLETMKEAVRKAREKNVAVDNRPTRFVFPTVYPTAGRPYYPTPAWYSIFGGDIYEYMSTIVSDRYIRKRNSNIIGRIIYLHNDYMQQLFIQEKAQADADKMAEIRDTLYKQINQWLANRDNAGQSLLAFTFMGTDGKEHKSFEIVEIEANSKDAAAANEKETAEISSVIFMALGLDARLLGSSPLSLVGSHGGTDIRERFLLRLILKSPAQQLMLKTMDVISRFNEWDRHLVWQIPRQVMTTLDNSKSGIATDSDSTE